ncbi:transcriptional activator protein CopR [Rhodobiaceae bacterium]|nr:transcriptional activator protein CopR [Rhodobiaceae bacterium]
MKILLAEDDPQTSEFIRKGLMQAGHSVEAVDNGRDALSYCLYNECDVVVLDRMMPGMDGLTVVTAMRSVGRKMPVLFLTARSAVDDRVEGLTAGADDYLVKPFQFSELEARIIALGRRPVTAAESTKLVVHDLELDLMSRVAERAGQPIALQAKEFAILEVLMRNPGRIQTRTMLLEKVWDFNFDPQTSVVETHISRLRSKIDKPFSTSLIRNVRSAGYTISAPV